MQTKLLIVVLIGLAAIGGLITASSLDPIFAGKDAKKKKHCFGLDLTKKQCKELRKCIKKNECQIGNLSP
jgi:hypothetical protein